MNTLKHLDKNPIETILEVNIRGNFNPNVLNPNWFAENKLIGELEAKSVVEKHTIENESRSFSTQFIDVLIERNRIRFGVKDLQNYDILFDLVIGSNSKLKNSIDRSFEINLKLHYELDSKSSKRKSLSSFIDNDIAQNFFEKPNVSTYKIYNENVTKKYHTETQLLVSRCMRDDLKNPIHIFILNEFFLNIKPKMINITEVIDLTFCMDLLNESIDLANKSAKHI